MIIIIIIILFICKGCGIEFLTLYVPDMRTVKGHCTTPKIISVDPTVDNPIDGILLQIFNGPSDPLPTDWLSEIDK